MPNKGCCSGTNLHPVLDDKTNHHFRSRYWQGAAFLPTFLAVEKSKVGVSRNKEVQSKKNESFNGLRIIIP